MLILTLKKGSTVVFTDTNTGKVVGSINPDSKAKIAVDLPKHIRVSRGLATAGSPTNNAPRKGT